MYIAKSEGVNFWLEVLTDLQNRGVEDIMICCVDGLKGFLGAVGVCQNSILKITILQFISCKVSIDTLHFFFS